jgi:hypothetical protein
VPEDNKESNSEPPGPVQSPITPEAFERRKPVFNPLGKVEDINADEVKVADIRRHFFGLFLIYLQTVVGLGLALGLIIFLVPNIFGDNNTTVNSALGFLTLIIVVLGAIFMILATKIYNANQLIVTDINVTQVLQTGLFDRKVSELTMENVEDVTAEQHGIFPTLFNYGTLKVETAGEQNNFIFKYCPNPNAYAKALQDARGAYYAKHSPRQPQNV